MSQMTRLSAAFAVLAALASAAPAAMADQDRSDKRERNERRHRGDQDFAFRAMRAGEIMSLADIEARVIPRMRGARYIGSTFDRDSAVYTLKFMREASVIWIDVDGRSGRIVGR
jgi:hypothetical protein